MFNKIKMFLHKFKWYLKGHDDCSRFCPFCRHYNICVHDEYIWNLTNEK